MSKKELFSVESTLQSNLPNSKKHQSSFIQWFYNLPIKGKQLVGLFTSETISIIGLVGVGAVLIVAAGRTQLVRQAESELAVAEINYNSKTNQMKSSFRAQSDNAAIIAAAIAHSENQSLSSELRTQVKQILQNEVQASNIEYATLVGKNRQIIVNANADRTGETFDPNNLVSEVLKNPQQLQASQIVSWTELAKEAPSLHKGFANQDALIRYTITPVQDSKTGTVVGAIVAGDIVNGKLPIVENTLKAFGGGYSGVYFRKPSGELTLASALDQGEGKTLEQAQPDVPLINASLLKKAVDTPGQIVTGRGVAGMQSYTVAAKAMTDFNGNPVAVLVRGTQETALNRLLGDSLLLQVAISAITLAVDVWLAILLGQTIAQPLKRLQQTTQRFARGDRQVRAEIVTNDEVGQLAETFNELADSIVSKEKVLAQQTLDQQTEIERSHAFAEFTSRLYKSLTSDDILHTLVDGVRTLLKADRVVVYYFNQDYQSGTIAAESVAPGWTQAMDQIITDPLGKEEMDGFRNGRIVVCNNIYGENYTTCHCEILERLQVKANLVGPLFLDDDLLGLLAVHQCSSPRLWQEQDVALLKQAAVQTNLALKQAHLMEQLKRARLEAEFQRQKALKQAVKATNEIEQILGVIEQNRTKVEEAMEEGETQIIDSTRLI